MAEEKKKYKLLAGSHIVGKRRVKHGETFKEYPSKVEWIKERLEEIDPVTEVKADEPAREMFLRKEHRGGGKYRVINTKSGAILHEGLISSAEADEMIELLQGSPEQDADEE